MTTPSKPGSAPSLPARGGETAATLLTQKLSTQVPAPGHSEARQAETAESGAEKGLLHAAPGEVARALKIPELPKV